MWLIISLWVLFSAVVKGQKNPTCDQIRSNCTEICHGPDIETLIYPLKHSLNHESSISAVKCYHSIAHYGPYKYECQRVKYPMTPGFICGENINVDDPNAYVCYPTDSTLKDLPINAFIHGMGAGGNKSESDYRGLLETWASWGIVTVAPESCITGWCSNLFYDQETAVLEAQRLGSSLHPIFSRVNFSKVAISGHSMGGEATQMTAGQWMNNYMYNNFSAKCAILLHPALTCPSCQCNDMMKIPSMWTTGTNDNIVIDSAVINCFNKEKNSKVYPKIIADLIGATHFEPNDKDGGHLAPYMAQYMLCQLNNDQNACNLIYGNNQTSLCNACDYKQCSIVKS